VILGLGQTILYVGFWRNRDKNPFFLNFVIGSENTLCSLVFQIILRIFKGFSNKFLYFSFENLHRSISWKCALSQIKWYKSNILFSKVEKSWNHSRILIFASFGHFTKANFSFFLQVLTNFVAYFLLTKSNFIIFCCNSRVFSKIPYKSAGVCNPNHDSSAAAIKYLRIKT
jgi:hypothetical protein